MTDLLFPREVTIPLLLILMSFGVTIYLGRPLNPFASSDSDGVEDQERRKIWDYVYIRLALVSPIVGFVVYKVFSNVSVSIPSLGLPLGEQVEQWSGILFNLGVLNIAALFITSAIAASVVTRSSASSGYVFLAFLIGGIAADSVHHDRVEWFAKELSDWEQAQTQRRKDRSAARATTSAVGDAAREEAALALDQKGRRHVQMALNLEGYKAGWPDGKFGPKTRQALKQWQRSRGEPATGHLTRDQNTSLLLVPIPQATNTSRTDPGLAKIDEVRVPAGRWSDGVRVPDGVCPLHYPNAFVEVRASADNNWRFYYSISGSERKINVYHYSWESTKCREVRKAYGLL